MVSRAGGGIQLQLRHYIQLAESEFRLSRQVPGSDLSRYASRRSRTTSCVSIVHGTWRSVDGISFRRLRADAFRVSRKLGLVPLHIPRLRLIREQHVATNVGDSTRRRPQASGDSQFARDFQIVAERVVSMGKRFE